MPGIQVGSDVLKFVEFLQSVLDTCLVSCSALMALLMIQVNGEIGQRIWLNNHNDRCGFIHFIGNLFSDFIYEFSLVSLDPLSTSVVFAFDLTLQARRAIFVWEIVDNECHHKVINCYSPHFIDPL